MSSAGSAKSAVRMLMGIVFGFVVGLLLFQAAKVPLPDNLTAAIGEVCGTLVAPQCGGGSCPGSQVCAPENTDGSPCFCRDCIPGFDCPSSSVAPPSSASNSSTSTGSAPCCDTTTMKCVVTLGG